MKLLTIVIVFSAALGLSTLAGIISIIGMTALFPAGGILVAIMMAVLEASKLVAAGWLHANWRNAAVSVLHKTYLSLAVLAIMIITGIGIYGYLAKGYLEQQVPLASVSLQIAQKNQQIETDNVNIKRLNDRQAQLDAAINTLITHNSVNRSQTIRNQQKKEREQIAADMVTAQKDVTRLTDELVPLKMSTSNVEAKLGPIKYVADLFGWTNPDIAVRMVILILMFAFDPLAIMLVLSGAISARDYFKTSERKQDQIDEAVHRPATKISMDLKTNPATFVETTSTDETDKESILRILKSNPAIIEDVVDTVIQWHEKPI